jgi:nucleoside-diphosphate-sugar epimerase
LSRVLVTGAGGFVGRRVVARLIDAGHEVHAASLREGTQPREATGYGVDLLDPNAAEELVSEARADALVHLAWYTEHGQYWDAAQNLEWVEASLRLWRAFSAAGGRRFVGVGSCAEYEWGEPVLAERASPLRPATLYGACKDSLRQILESAARSAPTSFAWGRIFFTYGPGEHPDRLVSSVARRLVAGEPAPVSDGEQIRDFLEVHDLAAGLVALLESEVEGPVNLGSGEGVAVRRLVEELGRAAGRPDLIEFGALPRSPDDPPAIVADVTRLREEVGWTPTVSLSEGLANAVSEARQAVR